MNVLVVGGAGSIGSHMVKRRGDEGIDVTILDYLSSGSREAVLCGEIVVGESVRDPACLVADSKRAKAELGWRPAFADLDNIVAHAWQWERQQTSKEQTQ